MSLFSFIRDTGEKLFRKPDYPGQKLRIAQLA